jgi:hypothetical protein
MDPFDMIIGTHGQFVTTAQTTTLNYFAPIRRSHALPETMYAQTSANFGLVSSFGHTASFHLQIMIAI